MPNERSSDHATLVINTPAGPVYVQSNDPDKVSIGSINLTDGSSLEMKTKGSAQIGEVNVGTPAVLARNLDETMASENGALAITTIAIGLIVFSVIWAFGSRVLSDRSDQRY